ncbi:DNA alkylation repair protein [Paenibacillus planticolens]|uniref:DNA alkylation repair protein n=1 Tax=Paenibacillus planticolens TaxID=2654976 RepID=A0ABX1ZIF4_9BACL|nr:DNA alkylation repair protein [Paenibacillus planticolens]NOU99859.1 DNA alkylation repair protein [Paenibacillus planticolens]
MTFDEVMGHLEELGSEQTKKTFLRHGAQEPFFGVKVGDLKKLVKNVKKDRDLALALYDSGNTDAMYLAGLSINPKTMTKEELQNWAQKAYWYMLAEYTVAGVAAESGFALEMARVWLHSPDEMLTACGWSTYANYISITPDEKLDLQEIAGLLEQVRTTIHEERNRVKYTMNTFVLTVGTYCHPLFDTAVDVAKEIGKVHVDVGQTACKVPLATDYIHKVEAMGRIGTKKKTCIC